MAHMPVLSLSVEGYIRDTIVEAVIILTNRNQTPTLEAITTFVADHICRGVDVNAAIAPQIFTLGKTQAATREANGRDAPAIEQFVVTQLNHLSQTGEIIDMSSYYRIHPCNPAFALFR